MAARFASQAAWLYPPGSAGMAIGGGSVTNTWNGRLVSGPDGTIRSCLSTIKSSTELKSAA